MKKIKYLLCLLLVLALFALVGCSKNKIKTGEDAGKYFNDAISEYSESDAVSFILTMEKGTEKQTVTVAYKFANNKVDSLSAVLKNDKGEVSLYIENKVAYMARYQGEKVYYTITDAEADELCKEYNFKELLESLTDIYTSLFFKACEVKEATKEKVTLACDLGAIEADESLDPDAYFAAQDLIEKLQDLTSMDVTLTLENNKLVKFEGVNVNKEGVTNKVTLELLGTGDAVSVSSPVKSEYKEK